MAENVSNKPDPQAKSKTAPDASNTERVTGTTTPNTHEETKSDAIAEDFQRQIHEAVREEQEKGYRGEAADPTPNEHYTVAGVLDDSKHVPEEFKTQTGVTVWPEDVVKTNTGKK